MKILSLFILIFNLQYISSIDHLSMLPLNTGNVWVYSIDNSGAQYKHVVIGDTIINGLRYCVVSGQCSQNNPFFKGVLPRYIKMDSAYANLYEYKYGNKCLFDSLRSSQGNTFLSCNQLSRYLESTGTTNLFGVHVDKMKFSSLTDSNRARYYASTIGIFISYQSDFYYHLQGCVIDGITYGDTSFSILGIEPIGSEIPEIYSLSQNYPNPFNPITNIEFQIPTTGIVKLIVFNALGQEVQTLVNRELSPGTYKADFDGSNLPSGVYYYKLESGSYTETKKMVLIK